VWKLTQIQLLLGLLLSVVAPARAVTITAPVTITLERSTEAAPSSVNLKATLKNVSGENITIGVGGPLMDYEIIVTNAEHIPVPLSKRGLKVFSKNQIRSTMYVAVTLRPGETSVETWSIDDLFDFATRPGRYFITVRRKIGNEITGQVISSNVLGVSLK